MTLSFLLLRKSSIFVISRSHAKKLYRKRYSSNIEMYLQFSRAMRWFRHSMTVFYLQSYLFWLEKWIRGITCKYNETKCTWISKHNGSFKHSTKTSNHFVKIRMLGEKFYCLNSSNLTRQIHNFMAMSQQ